MKLFNNIKYKRFIAYLIDIFIISFVVSLLSGIKVINPKADKYNKTVDRYNNYIKEVENKPLEKPEDIFTKEYIDITYKLSYYGMSYTITKIVVVILYFSLYPFFFDGQTIGKKLLKIKIINKDEKKKLPLWKLLIRSIILPISSSVMVYTVFSESILVGLVLFTKNMVYIKASLIVSSIMTILGYADIFRFASNKDSESLHDKILKTKVIEC